VDFGWTAPSGVDSAPERLRYREIEQLKTEIIAAVSHELKTPIASIKAYAMTLRVNPDAVAAQRDEFLRIIEDEADRLERRVDDLLLASRVEAEQLLKERVLVALDEIIDKALETLAFDLEDHPVVRHTHDVKLSGDPDLLRDVFAHLIENAGKFSPIGTAILIEAASRERDVTVDITDDGLGIAPEHLPYIFDRFYRVERELTASAGGSGLGLFIVRGLVHAHGGSIAVRSEPGCGSTFTLRLPLR
jgi:two-component system, OmpR family, phosphate regulon sensor histidine kinase PhoR